MRLDTKENNDKANTESALPLQRQVIIIALTANVLFLNLYAKQI